ncbi:MAG: radical SAM protein, partial [Bacteroidales bacterium]|nr:radical SAM protein [Bacteroidales bacterium]
LNRVEGIERYRISSIEPNLLSEEIIDWIASGTKFQPHFHIPLQSGSDEILSRMGRRYDTAFFASKIGYIRRKMEGPRKPKVFFGIDIMTGLPGETEEKFLRSRSFIEELHPAFLHIFPYSIRPGTRAASMPDQVDPAVKAARVASLEELSARLHSEFVAAHKGMRAEVLFESTRKGEMMSGYTGNYIRVSRPWDPGMVGKIAEVEI